MKKHWLRNILLSLLFALLLVIFVHLAAIFALHTRSLTRGALVFFIGFVAALILFKRRTRLMAWLTGTTVVLCVIAAVIMFFSIKAFSASAVYTSEDGGKESLFADKKVLIIVPHQDDELNLMSGAIEEYRKYGSEVYVLFTTNGDAVVTAEQRLNEAINALECVGVDEEHIIFLDRKSVV